MRRKHPALCEAVMAGCAALLGCVARPPTPAEAAVSSRTESVAQYQAVDKLPVVLYWASPEYPKEALSHGVAGTVVLAIHVNARGVPDSMTVVHSIPELDEAAEAAACKYRFTPGERAGEAVAAWVQLPVEFVAEGGGALDLSYVARLDIESAARGTVTVYARVSNPGDRPWAGCVAFVPLCMARRVVKAGDQLFARGFCRTEALQVIADGGVNGGTYCGGPVQDASAMTGPPWPCDDTQIPARGALADTLVMPVDLRNEPEWTDVLVHTHLRTWTRGAGVRFFYALDTTLARPGPSPSN